jgi:hypothetical protein
VWKVLPLNVSRPFEVWNNWRAQGTRCIDYKLRFQYIAILQMHMPALFVFMPIRALHVAVHAGFFAQTVFGDHMFSVLLKFSAISEHLAPVVGLGFNGVQQ